MRIGLFALAGITLVSGCVLSHEDIDQVDSAYYNGDHRRVHCSIDIDSVTRNDDTSIEHGLDRAVDRGEVLELFAHIPGETVDWDTIDHLFSAAQARGLPFVTYSDIVNDRAPAAGLAFAFDDSSVENWMQGQQMFATYGARITFFLTRYHEYTDGERADMHTLAASGHDVEAHSVEHLRGPDYVEDHGMDAYLADEVQPSIDLLTEDGYTVSTYAYPYGARTDETDRALLERVQILRSVAMTWKGAVEDPCPLD